MAEYKNCIVAFLDILGFKGIIKNVVFDDVMMIFKRIISENDAKEALKRSCTEKDDSLCLYNKALEKTDIRVMSDSIVVAAPSEYKESLAVVIDICNAIQEELYELDMPIFLRGAISEGEIYIDGKLIFGKGLVDAYLAQEYYAIYPRIIVSSQICSNYIVCIDNEKVLPKDDEDEYFYLDTLHQYIDIYNLSYVDCVESEKYLKLSQYIENQLTGYSERRVREKYVWIKNALENALDYDNKMSDYKIEQMFNKENSK